MVAFCFDYQMVRPSESLAENTRFLMINNLNQSIGEVFLELAFFPFPLVDEIDR